MGVLEKQQSVGQSLWLGHISRAVIRDGTLMRYVDAHLITGLTFSPQAFRCAIAESDVYDAAILRKLDDGLYGESLACSLIYDDVRYAADLLRAVFERTDGVDGWATIPVSPLSASDNDSLVSMLTDIHDTIDRPNVLLCLPARADRLPIIEELVFLGIPISIANIYSPAQYSMIVKSCLTGIERRIASARRAVVSTFITINIARLEAELSRLYPRDRATDLSVATGRKIYRLMRELGNSEKWGRVFSSGARPLRLVWTYAGGTNLPAPNTALYNELIAPYTVVALPDESIEKFIAQPVSGSPMTLDGGDCEEVLDKAVRDGLDLEGVADALQQDYIEWMSVEWVMLLEAVARKSAGLKNEEPLSR